MIETVPLQGVMLVCALQLNHSLQTRRKHGTSEAAAAAAASQRLASTKQKHYYPRQGGHVLPGVYPSAGQFVSRITRKVAGGFG